MVFYKGALSYQDLLWMPIPELYIRQKHAQKIIDQTNAYMEKRKNGR